MATDEHDHQHDHQHDHNGHDPLAGEEVDDKLQAEFDELLNVGIDVAQQLLEEEGGFLPFAVALTTGGETQVLMLDEDDIDGEEALDALLEELTENRESLLGAAVVSDVLLDDDQDAIRIDIEHSDLATEAMVMALEYAPATDTAPATPDAAGTPDGGAADEGTADEGTADDYEYGELLGSVGERRIWV